MKYIDLIKNIREPIFSLQDLRLAGLKIYHYQLSEWSEKGYIIKLKNGVYAHSSAAASLMSEYIAFNLYQPSYVSLEWALSKYGLIPEMVYNCTSVTTKTTRSFKNKFGAFSFRSVKKELFFGYNKIHKDGQVYLMAEPEKALFDYAYLNSSQINNKDDISELRLNEFALKDLDRKKLKKYFLAANSKKMMKIFKLLYVDIKSN